MKKIISLILAAVMMLACLPAVAEESAAAQSASAAAAATTVNVKLAVDKGELKAVLTQTGTPEEQLASIEPVLDLLNALTVKAVIADGFQLDLILGETTALSLGGAVNENGLLIGSSMIPSYLINITAEQLQGMMQQFMPMLSGGEGGEGGLDMNAIGEAVSKYMEEFMGAFQTAVVPGEAETGSWEFEGVTFDTKTPVDIDEMALAEAVKKLVNDLLNDEAIKGALANIPNFDAEEILKSLDETLSEEHVPEVKAEMYASSADGSTYMVSEATYKDQEAPAYTFAMLNAGGVMKMTITMEEKGVALVITTAQDGFLLEMLQGEAYMGLRVAIAEDGFVLTVLSEPEKAALTVTVTVEQGGELTLSLDPEGRTVVTMEDLQGENAEKIGQGVAVEAQMGLMKLMAIPEIAQMVQSFMPTTQTEETPVADPE